MSDHKDHITPPGWSLKLMRLFMRHEYLEEIEGDMEEVFQDDLERFSPGKARRRYSWQMLKLMRPALMRHVNSQKFNNLSMFKHNLLIAFRGFKRHQLTFLINLIGLSTGLAASLMIYLWIDDERSVDAFNEDNDRLFWVMANFDFPDGVDTWEYTSGLLAEGLTNEFPEVEKATRVSNNYHRPYGVMSKGEDHYEVNGLYAGENFFDVMTYPLLYGDKQEVLKDKERIAISASLAERIFGSAKAAYGQTIAWESRYFNRSYLISGVFQDPPANATQQFNALINYERLIDHDESAGRWNGGYAFTFIRLNEGVDAKSFEQKMAKYLDGKADNKNRFTLFLQQYSDRYLYSQFDNGKLVGGRVENVRLFTVIAIFIVLIACINFMNLSTAQATRKMKEIGVKKAIGAQRRQLIGQFLAESVLMALISFALAIAMVALLLSQFSAISGKDLTLDLSEHLDNILLITLAAGFVAGSYPAFFLSGFNPVAVLKGKINQLSGAAWVRRSLVVAQFCLSVIFISGVIVINKQIRYTQTKNLGYNRDQVLMFESRGDMKGDMKGFMAEVSNLPGVVSASTMMGGFLWGEDSGSGYSWSGNPEERDYLFLSPKVGPGVIETLGMELIAGRSYNPEFKDEYAKAIINESAVKMMGLDEPIGHLLGYGSGTREIIGVVKDFQYGSLHKKIEPIILRYRDDGRDVLVKVKAGTELNTISQIEEVYHEFHPKYRFESSFLDDDYQALYTAETRIARLSNYMAGVAIIISCLGLFGLAAFTAERRRKEIGIRKVLGASRMAIMKILSTSFLKVILVAVVLALPLGYLLTSQWLQNFAYTIDLSWTIFATAGLIAILIALLTVAFQTLKAANMNPVNYLRDE